MTDLLSRIEAGEPVEAQEVFDFAVSKVIEQGRPATVGSICAYRADMDRKCAFGHLIPDSLYESRFEGGSVYSILNTNGALKYSSELSASLGRHLDLLADLQSAHDRNATRNAKDFVTNFRHRAEAVAKRYGLTFNF